MKQFIGNFAWRVYRQCVLIGYSLGSMIALDLALAYPEKVTKPTLVSPGLAGFQEHNQEYLDVLGTYPK